MNDVTTKLLATAIVIIVGLGLRFIAKRLHKKVSRKLAFQLSRRVLINKVINISLTGVAGVAVLGIWGLGSDDLVVYLTSVFTVIGIAFFAQWSHLSNITAGVILFFSTNIKIGDTVKIIEGDSSTTGSIEDIGLYFVVLISPDKERILLANSLFLQKMVQVNHQKPAEQSA